MNCTSMPISTSNTFTHSELILHKHTWTSVVTLHGSLDLYRPTVTSLITDYKHTMEYRSQPTVKYVHVYTHFLDRQMRDNHHDGKTWEISLWFVGHRQTGRDVLVNFPSVLFVEKLHFISCKQVTREVKLQ